MPNRDGANDKVGSIGTVVTAISSDTTTAGAVVDCSGFDIVTFEIFSNAYTDGTYTPLINESDDSGMSGESAVADIDLTVTEADAAVDAANTVKYISYIGNKRYITCDIVSTSTSSGASVGVNVIKEKGALLPE
jgi:hypothetical protein